MKDALNAAYPDAVVVTDTLAARVAARLEHPAKPNRRRFLAPMLATVALAGLGLYAIPRWLDPRPVYALGAMDKALKNVKRIQISRHAGSWHVSEEWYEGNNYRRDDCSPNNPDTCRVVSLTVGNQSYWPDYEKNEVIFSTNNELTESPIHSLSQILHVQDLAGLQGKTTFEGTRFIEGRSAIVVKIDLPWRGYELGNSIPKPRYQKLYIDTKTDLPFLSEEYRLEWDGWYKDQKEIRFNQSLPPQTFATEFPGMKRKSLHSQASESFYQAMQRPGKHSTTTQNGITLHGFSVMEALGLVVWYTVDNESTLPALVLGGKGHTCPLLAQGVVGDTDSALRQRYTLQGKRLRWAYFRQNFVAPMGNGDWGLSFNFPEGSATFTPEVGGFESTLPSGEAGEEIGKAFPSLAGERARDRAEYFMDGRWQDDGPLVGAAQLGQLNPKEQALFWLREAVRQDNKWLTAPKHARDWRRMAEILDQLKRHDEAKVYRDKADAER